VVLSDPDFDDVDLPLLHERAYHVRAYQRPEGSLLLRGSVRDTKPPGFIVEDDTEPITIHHMVIELTVDPGTQVITVVDVVMETYPHTVCPRIIDHYDQLVGLSIGRGYISKVRELFGGPRGCTHVTALLLAMGPVVAQSLWSLRANANIAGPRRLTDAERAAMLSVNIGSCHVWAADGEFAAAVRSGEGPHIPMWAEERLSEHGVDPATWRGNVG
jgi:hypothetical protein